MVKKKNKVLFQVLQAWWIDAKDYISGPKGYRFIIGSLATAIGAYAGIYAIIEARYERRLNSALFERATFMSMVTSGSRASFIAAMDNFGPVQNISVPFEPEIWPPFYNWFGEQKPNREPLWRWAWLASFECTIDKCGKTYPYNRKMDKRILLKGANLKEADLHWVDFSNADLSYSDLQSADLHGGIFNKANFSGANLKNANLYYTSFPGAFFDGADMRGSIFTGVDVLEQAQIDRACVDETTIFEPAAKLHVTPLSQKICQRLDDRAKGVLKYPRDKNKHIGEPNPFTGSLRGKDRQLSD